MGTDSKPTIIGSFELKEFWYLEVLIREVFRSMSVARHSLLFMLGRGQYFDIGLSVKGPHVL